MVDYSTGYANSVGRINGILDKFYTNVGDLEPFIHYDQATDAASLHFRQAEGVADEKVNTIISEIDSVKSDFSTKPDGFVADFSTAFSTANSKLSTLPTKFTSAESLASNNFDVIEGELDGKKVIEGDYFYNSSSDNFIVPTTKMDYNLTEVSKTNYDDLDKLIPKLKDAADKINPELDTISDGVKDKISEHFDNYEEIIPHYIPAAENVNESLQTIGDEISVAESKNNSVLNDLIPKFTAINATVNSELIELADNIEPI